MTQIRKIRFNIENTPLQSIHGPKKKNVTKHHPNIKPFPKFQEISKARIGEHN